MTRCNSLKSWRQRICATFCLRQPLAFGAGLIFEAEQRPRWDGVNNYFSLMV
jgi:hypothetical protein